MIGMTVVVGMEVISSKVMSPDLPCGVGWACLMWPQYIFIYIYIYIDSVLEYTVSAQSHTGFRATLVYYYF